jgi:hypothetical protein
MTRRLLPWILVALAAGVLCQSCRRGGTPRFNEEALFYSAVLIPADGRAIPADAAALGQALSGAAWPDPAWSKAAQAAQPLLASRELKVQMASPKDFPIPEVQYLTGFGYGMTEEDMVRCAASTRVYQIILTLPPAEAVRTYPAFQALTLAAAQAMKGYVFDVSAKMAFTPAEYGRTLFNPSDWDLSRHVLVQRYPYQPGRFRVVTLGMAKFACPEVEVRDFPAKDGLLFQHLAAAAATRLVSLRLRGEPGAFPEALSLDPAAIKNAPGRPGKEPASGAASVQVRLEAGETAEGDPQDNIVRLAPPEGFSGGLPEWSSALSEKVLGFGLQVDYMAAGGIPAAKIQAARAGLPGVRERFLAPHPAGEEYYVKFACTVEGAGVEYLWLKVAGWDGDGVAGTLLTEPALAKQFTAGQPLRVAGPEVVDWMIRGAGGKIEGRLTE